jgi:hypothetical protein
VPHVRPILSFASSKNGKSTYPIYRDTRTLCLHRVSKSQLSELAPLSQLNHIIMWRIQLWRQSSLMKLYHQIHEYTTPWNTIVTLRISRSQVMHSRDLSVRLSLKPFFFFNGSTAPCWALASFSLSWLFLQTVGLLGRVISSSQGFYLNTGQHKHIHTPNIHTLCWIRTHDPSLRASEDSSCLRPLGYCDRHWNHCYGISSSLRLLLHNIYPHCTVFLL